MSQTEMARLAYGGQGLRTQNALQFTEHSHMMTCPAKNVSSVPPAEHCRSEAEHCHPLPTLFLLLHSSFVMSTGPLIPGLYLSCLQTFETDLFYGEKKTGAMESKRPGQMFCFCHFFCGNSSRVNGSQSPQTHLWHASHCIYGDKVTVRMANLWHNP